MRCAARGGFDHENRRNAGVIVESVAKTTRPWRPNFGASHNIDGNGIQANDMNMLTVDVWTAIRGIAQATASHRKQGNHHVLHPKRVVLRPGLPPR
ncbi:hypothetical protein THIX_10634 [Thiomonas sp. X19]|nr:hypothetical protein THIX_10634 [Thiomonas sp. X19]